jgi:hypothetical protein
LVPAALEMPALLETPASLEVPAVHASLPKVLAESFYAVLSSPLPLRPAASVPET